MNTKEIILSDKEIKEAVSLIDTIMDRASDEVELILLLNK